MCEKHNILAVRQDLESTCAIASIMASIWLLLEALIRWREGNDELVVPMEERWKEKAKGELGGIMRATKQSQEWSISRDILDCFRSRDRQTQAWELGEPGIWP